MEALGAYLKKNREQRGVSLEEMAASTKINLSVLSYLEEDKFDKLPAPVFVKGFIKAYLAYLGINPKEAILFYELISGDAQKKPQILSPMSVDQKDEAQQTERVYNIKLSQRGLIVVIAVAAALVLALMYFVIFPSSSSDDMSDYRKRMLLRMAPQPAETKVETPPAETAVQTTTPEAPKTEPVVKVVEKKPETTPAPATPPADPQKIIIKAKQDVWVKAQIDDGKPFDFLLRSNNTKKLEAKKELKILLGDAAAVDLEYQGQVMTDLGQKGFTRSIVFPGLGRWKDAIVQQLP